MKTLMVQVTNYIGGECNEGKAQGALRTWDRDIELGLRGQARIGLRGQ